MKKKLLEEDEVVNMKNITFFLIIFILLFPVLSFSQQFTEWQPIEEVSAGNFFGVGARAMGMGGAHIACVNDATALFYNPAGLARVKRLELSLGLTHQRFKNETGFSTVPSNLMDYIPYYENVSRRQSNTRFSSASFVYPVPTYRGSLVFGLGVFRMMSFDKTFKYSYIPSSIFMITDAGEELVSESGGVNMWSAGGALDISPNISIGLALNYWHGGEDYSLESEYSFWQNDTLFWLRYNDEIYDDYSGFSAKLGMSVWPSKYFSFGLTLESPTWLTVDEEYILRTESTYDIPWTDTIWIEEDRGFPLYKLTHPYKFGMGAAFYFKNILLTGDINYTDWSQLKYREGFEIGEKNRNVKEYYRDVLRWGVGAEVLVPWISSKLRAGYYSDPLPYDSPFLNSDRDYLTFGFGFLIDRVMTIDFGWIHGFYNFEYEQDSFKEDYTTDRFYITTAFRL
ncbi:MAG: outer membrane protein transport protein [Candidatus Zixiibacteriota bacterium]